VSAGALMVIASVLPSMMAIFPGAPLCSGEVAAVGDAVRIPGDVSGRVRVLVTAQLDPKGNSRLALRLAGAVEAIEASFERTSGHLRGEGHRVSSTGESTYIASIIPKEAGELRVEQLRGDILAPIRIAVFGPGWPLWGALLVGFVALLLPAVLAWRRELPGSALAAVAMALGYGLAVFLGATPEEVWRPAKVALVSGALPGLMLGGSLAWWISRRSPHIADSRPAPRARRSRRARGRSKQ
jgi:hypothetical protein